LAIELADTSAWSKSRVNASLKPAFDDLLVEGEIATCELVMLELLFSAQSADEFGERREQLNELPQCPISGDVWQRAFDVFEQIAALGPLHHRQIKPIDLVIAAAAEVHGVGVLHYDQHFDVIAGVTGQPTRWIAPQGTLP
jgi:predicted nucleic acid-binding protein